MSEEKTIGQVIAESVKRMEQIVARWFSNDAVLLGAWALVDKIPDPKQKTIGIDSRSNPPSIRYNPYFINTLNKEYLEAVMASEAFKILLKHPTTRLQKPKAISNMASQITVNSCIMGSIVDQQIFANALKSEQFGMETNQWLEYYFRYLLEHLPESLTMASKMFQKDIKEDSGMGQGQNQGSEGQEKEGYQQFKNSGQAMKEYFDPSSTANQDWAINDLLDADVQNMVNEKKGSTKQWGTFTGNAMDTIVATNTPKISYKDIIRRFHNSVISTKQTPSRMKLNRRYGLAAPGHRRVYKSKLIFAIDASGSMSDEDLKEGFAVVNSLCKHSQLEYLLFDTEIKLTEKKFKKAKKSFKVSGRGGTDFQQIMDYANKKNVDGMIVYTDGCAPAPTKPERTKILWLMTNNELKPPVEWGMRAILNRMENLH